MDEQRKESKPLKFYLFVFLTVSVGILLHGLYAHTRTEGTYLEWVLNYAYIPFFITAIIYIFNRVVERVRPSSPEFYKQQRFVMHMSKMVKDTLAYDVEDFKTLRHSSLFQDKMYVAYTIYHQDESDEANYAMMVEGFEADSVEYKAVEAIADEVKLLREQNIQV